MTTKSVTLKKPKTVSRKSYDWSDCTRYIEQKYQITTRNYFNHKFDDPFDTIPYCDFWHWMCDSGRNIHNGCYIAISDEELGLTCPQWVKDILALYVKEFGRKTKYGKSALFYCEW